MYLDYIDRRLMKCVITYQIHLFFVFECPSDIFRPSSISCQIVFDFFFWWKQIMESVAIQY